METNVTQQATITVFDDSVGIYGEKGLLDEYQEYTKVFKVPGLTLRREILNHVARIYAIQDESPSSYGIRWNAENLMATVIADSSTLRSGVPLIFLAQNITERLRQERSQFTLHGNAVVTPDGQGIVLLGAKRAGKTTTTIELCNKYDCGMYANGQVIIGRESPTSNQLALIAGAKELHVRRSNIAQLNRQTKEEEFAKDSTSSFDEKVTVSPEEIGLKSPSGIFPLSKVVFIHLNPLLNQEVDSKEINGSSLRANLEMSEVFQRIISGIYTPLLNTKNEMIGLSPSFASDKTRRNVSDTVMQLFDERRVIEVSGSSLQKVCTSILSLIK